MASNMSSSLSDSQNPTWEAPKIALPPKALLASDDKPISNFSVYPTKPLSPGDILTPHTSHLLGYVYPPQLKSVEKIKGPWAYVVVESRTEPVHTRQVVIGRYEVAAGLEPREGFWKRFLESWEYFSTMCFTSQPAGRRMGTFDDEWV